MSMYPTISGYSNAPSAQTAALSGAFQASQSPGSPKEQSSTLPRVVIAEKYRVAPPVLAPYGASTTLASSNDTAAQHGAASFDFERGIVKELEGQAKPMTAVNGLRHQDRFEALTSQCVSSGFSREEASMALAVALATVGARIDGPAVKHAAENIRTMRGMDIPFSAAVGALVAKKGDLDSAIDMIYN